MEKELLGLGLTWNEAKVYMSLTKIGDSPVSHIIKDLKFHRQIVYGALEELERKGLVLRTTKRKIFHFRIADPKVFVENAKKQELLAMRLSKNIDAALKHNRRESEINIYNSQRGVRHALLENYRLMPMRSTQYIWAASAKRQIEILGERFFQEEYDRLRKKRKIFSKNLAGKDTRNEVDELIRSGSFDKTIREFRFLSLNSLPMFTTVVWHDRVTMLSMTEDIFLIEIINQNLRDSFKDQFDLLWRVAKK